MTTLPPVAGASASSPPAVATAKTSAPGLGFQAALDSAAASSQHLSTPDQPGNSRKSTDKDEAASPTKQGGSALGGEALLSLLVAPPTPVPAEPLSGNPSVQGSSPDLKQGSEALPAIAVIGSTDSGSAIGLPETTSGIIPGNGAASAVPAPAKGVDSKHNEDKLESVPPGLPAGTTQDKLPAVLQPARAETQAHVQRPAERFSKAVPVDNAGQPAEVRTAVQTDHGGLTQPRPASQFFADTSSVFKTSEAIDPALHSATTQALPSAVAPSASTHPKAADPALHSAAIQLLPQAVASAAPVNAGADRPAQPGKPELHSAIGPPKAESPATAPPLTSSGAAQENGEKANPQSDSAPPKKYSAGDPDSTGTAPAQVFAAGDNGAAQSVAPNAASPVTTPHQVFSTPALPGASSALQTAAVHPPEPNASAVALPQINTARVLGSMQGTELRVGMHSQEFGSVAIATSISQAGVAAQILLDHGGLSRALAAHLPGIEEKLGHTLGVQARVEVLGTGTGAGQSGQGNSAPREGSRQDHGFPAAPATSAREPYFAQTPLPEIGEQAVGELRLSVRA